MADEPALDPVESVVPSSGTNEPIERMSTAWQAPGPPRKHPVLLVVVVAFALLGLGLVSGVFRFWTFTTVQQDYAPGQCSNRSSSPDPAAPLVLLPCDQAHLFEIVGTVQLPREVTSMSAASISATPGCVAAFEEYTGTTFAGHPTLTLRLMTWPPETWPQGHRTAGCAAERIDKAPMVGSIKVLGGASTD